MLHKYVNGKPTPPGIRFISPFDNPQLALVAFPPSVGIFNVDIATVVLAVQPDALVPITVYVMFAEGVAVTDEPVVAEIFVLGAHV